MTFLFIYLSICGVPRWELWYHVDGFVIAELSKNRYNEISVKSGSTVVMVIENCTDRVAMVAKLLYLRSMLAYRWPYWICNICTSYGLFSIVFGRW